MSHRPRPGACKWTGDRACAHGPGQGQERGSASSPPPPRAAGLRTVCQCQCQGGGRTGTRATRESGRARRGCPRTAAWASSQRLRPAAGSRGPAARPRPWPPSRRRAPAVASLRPLGTLRLWIYSPEHSFRPLPGCLWLANNSCSHGGGALTQASSRRRHLGAATLQPGVLAHVVRVEKSARQSNSKMRVHSHTILRSFLPESMFHLKSRLRASSREGASMRNSPCLAAQAGRMSPEGASASAGRARGGRTRVSASEVKPSRTSNFGAVGHLFRNSFKR